MDIDITKFMTEEEMKNTGMDTLNEEQKQALAQWGIRMYGLGQYRVAEIEDIKFDGRLVILDDDSKWEVSSSDASTTSRWGTFSKVVVIDDEMYLLNDSEMVDVEEFDG